LQPNGAAIVSIGGDKEINAMAVYPAGGLAGRPLLIAAHGNGGSGPREIEGWISLASQHRFTVVCPTFLSAHEAMYLPSDQIYFGNCLHWIENHLQYDKKNVFMTGFSGGGAPVWYLGVNRADFFKGLFLQSGNFDGDQYYTFHISDWKDKPIRLIWGSQDTSSIIEQNRQAIQALESAGLRDFSTQIVPGAHHQPHHDLVVAWMEQHSSGD
jgi:poly(3-hydroxybutyrate) depolymerase